MFNRTKRTGGFSLVELIIVIVILGIIAAVAIPRLSSGSRNASESALRVNLQAMRNAIDYYYTEHHNVFPAANGDGTNAADSAEAFETQLLQWTKANGTVSANQDAAFPYGPYIRGKLPKLTVGANVGVSTFTVVNQATPLTTSIADGTAWVYNVATGELIANADALGTNGDAYSTY